MPIHKANRGSVYRANMGPIIQRTSTRNVAYDGLRLLIQTNFMAIVEIIFYRLLVLKFCQSFMPTTYLLLRYSTDIKFTREKINFNNKKNNALRNIDFKL
jgi:hypothetical protein